MLFRVHAPVQPGAPKSSEKLGDSFGTITVLDWDVEGGDASIEDLAVSFDFGMDDLGCASGE